jgi:hypothetical protein
MGDRSPRSRRRDARQRAGRRQGAGAGSATFAPAMVEAAAPSSTASCANPCGAIEIALGAAVVRVGPWERRCDADESATRGEGCDVIRVPSGVRVLVATKPVDFRRGADSLATLAEEELRHDPFSGRIFVFRSKRADRLKILAWDGSGLILYWKRLEEGRFAGRQSATA